ncbi:G-type lectin S-receptor-like serine/threonine-protein kinase LECRK3 [Euphorbia peplus]|nr:G-type lectin S-receptor-like serine/threonine-protein kinase LECRK3 [Euphorbia peplus]
MASLEMIFFLIPFLLHLVYAQQNITLNSSLVANDDSSVWLSPSGDFAFGFQKLRNTQDLFLLSIWFDKIPDKTIVWYAKKNPLSRGSMVHITATGLSLTDPNGGLIWNQELNQTSTVHYCSMLDTGNFVLADRNSVYLWESFRSPRDTILPSQTLNTSYFLFSSFSETNYSRGRFKLSFSNEGDLRLNPLAWPSVLEYESYFTIENSSNNSQSALVFDESSSAIYLTNPNGERFTVSWKRQNISPTIASSYYRATLDFTGVFTVYAYPKGAVGDQNWSIVQYLPEAICSAINNQLGSGSCGYNSYCIIVEGRPTCKCPPGYSFIDENNQFRGCIPNFPVGCGVDDESGILENTYEIQPLPNVNWPFGDYERLPDYSEAECTTSCLQDCFCAAAIYNSGTCWKKRFPLGNGRQESGNVTALIRVRKGPSPTRTKKADNESILIGSLSASVVLNALLLIIASTTIFLFRNMNSSSPSPISVHSETNLHMFSYKELEEATNDFREEIGRGSSAIVYKGILKFDSDNVVAVKKLDKLAQSSEKEFKTEMKVIGKTSHKNLVRLHGFCEEGLHRILVYEFMNATLSNFLFKIEKPAWNIRVKIALEIARGILYLHEECEVPIIHCDIKPENVLLDESYTAKISDFGLAKLLHRNQSRTLTGIRGTRGYVAPEWFRNSAVTAKVDVYSYGVMLLEIIYCRKNVPKVIDDDGILIYWVYDCFLEGKIEDLAEIDEESAGDKERIRRWISIAIWCTQENPSTRPSMKMVLQMLEGFVDVPSPPMSLFSSRF